MKEAEKKLSPAEIAELKKFESDQKNLSNNYRKETENSKKKNQISDDI